jgi:hypothetical protein
MGLLLAALSVQFAALLALVVFFTATLVMLLLRPDNVLFAAAITLALLGYGQQRARILAAAVAAGLLAAAIYLWLNGVAHILSGVSTTRPWLARAARATVLGSAALGPGGGVGAGAAGAAWIRGRASGIPTVRVLAGVAVVPATVCSVTGPGGLFDSSSSTVTAIGGMQLVLARCYGLRRADGAAGHRNDFHFSTCEYRRKVTAERRTAMGRSGTGLGGAAFRDGD